MPEPLKARKRGHHICPKKGCRVEVANARFACQTHWHKLPADVQREIIATARLNVLQPRRRAAFRMAEQAWGD